MKYDKHESKNERNDNEQNNGGYSKSLDTLLDSCANNGAETSAEISRFASVAGEFLKTCENGAAKSDTSAHSTATSNTSMATSNTSMATSNTSTATSSATSYTLKKTQGTRNLLQKGSRPRRKHLGSPVAAAVSKYLNALSFRSDLTRTTANSDLNAEKDVKTVFTPAFGEDRTAECELYKRIFELKCEAANAKGIKTKLVPNEKPHESEGIAGYTLIRDARNIQQNGDNDDPIYRVAQLACTYAIAAKTLIKTEPSAQKYNAQIDGELIDACNKCVEEILRTRKENTTEADRLSRAQKKRERFINNILAPLVAGYTEKTQEDETKKIQVAETKKRNTAAVKKLNNASNWAALYQPTLAVATITKLDNENGAFVTYEEPLTKLTDELKAEITDRHKKYWYTSQSDGNKALIDHFEDQILRGHQIPSQLRAHLPGLKNAYRSTTAVFDKDVLKTITSSNHCAAIVPVIRSSDKIAEQRVLQQEAQAIYKTELTRLTKLGMKQQKERSGCQNSMMVTLNSVKGDNILSAVNKTKIFAVNFLKLQAFGALDRHIVAPKKIPKHQLLDHHMSKRPTEAVKDEENLSHSNLCLNGAGIVEKGDESEAIRKLNERINKKLAELSQDKRALDDIKNTTRQIQEDLQGTKEKFKEVKILKKPRQNLIFAAESINTNSQYNQLVDTLPVLLNKPKTAIFYGCASGENRTGALEIETQYRALLNYLTSTAKHNGDDLRDKVIQMLVASGHIHFMTGSQGSIMGAEGIRGKSKGAVSEEVKRACKKGGLELFTEASNFKNAKAKAPEEFQPLLKEIAELLENDTNMDMVKLLVNQALESLNTPNKSQKDTKNSKKLDNSAIELINRAIHDYKDARENLASYSESLDTKFKQLESNVGYYVHGITNVQKESFLKSDTATSNATSSTATTPTAVNGTTAMEKLFTSIVMNGRTIFHIPPPPPRHNPPQTTDNSTNDEAPITPHNNGPQS